MRLRPLILLSPLLPLAAAWECEQVRIGNGKFQYNLGPLDGTRTTSQSTDTPPTRNEARVTLNLCGKVDRTGGPDGDQCPDGTRLCLTLVNHKEGASDPERVTAVIPMWKEEDDDNIQLGASSTELIIEGNAGTYAGVQQSWEVELRCDRDASDPNPTFVSYTNGRLKLQWATPDACAENAPSGGSGSGGSSFWGFFKFMFWFGFFLLVCYLVLGALYNQQQYGARGWDLVPHRDFWRELPTLAGDLGGHLFQNVRSSTGRGGYSSLG